MAARGCGMLVMVCLLGCLEGRGCQGGFAYGSKPTSIRDSPHGRNFAIFFSLGNSFVLGGGYMVSVSWNVSCV